MDYNPPPVLFRIVYKMELQDVLSVLESWTDPHITAGQGRRCGVGADFRMKRDDVFQYLEMLAEMR